MAYAVKFSYDGQTFYIGTRSGGPAVSLDAAARFKEKEEADLAADKLRKSLWCHYGPPVVVPLR